MSKIVYIKLLKIFYCKLIEKAQVGKLFLQVEGKHCGKKGIVELLVATSESIKRSECSGAHTFGRTWSKTLLIEPGRVCGALLIEVTPEIIHH